ncbi:MAG: cysteine hydrolase [Lachnospiraceae bacterium]|nr:cysteine hydrolase [Lachnospiraceae bacterium]
MKKVLVVIDMQVDFTTGALKNEDAIAVIPAVKKRIEAARAAGEDIIFTRDTHTADYLSTEEGRNLPVEHCVKGTPGWEIVPELSSFAEEVIDKPTFGSRELGERLAEGAYDEVELIGVCTDICVISNAMIAKAFLPNAHVIVDGSCCAGVTKESHLAALEAMKVCHVEVRQ